MKPNYLFSENKEIPQKIVKRQERILRRMWLFRLLYVSIFFLILGLCFFYDMQKGSISQAFVWILICWLPPVLWFEIIVFSTEIKDYTAISLFNNTLVIKKLTHFSWKPHTITIPIKNIRKITIDGKSNKIIIYLTDHEQMVIKKSKGYLQTYLFQTRQLDNIIKVLKSVGVEYELVYP